MQQLKDITWLFYQNLNMNYFIDFKYSLYLKMSLQILKDFDILQCIDYKTRSGKIYKTYLNIEKIISYPKILEDLCNLFINRIQKSRINKDNLLICCNTFEMLTLASCISIKENIPMIFIKGHEIQGNFKKEDDVILISDVFNTGNFIKDTVSYLQINNLNVIKIISIYSRADQIIYYKNIHFEYLFHENYLNMILQYQETTIDEIMSYKNTKLCLYADAYTVNDLFFLIKKTGKYICILKIHSDTIKDFYTDYEYTKNKLTELKLKYKFKIWEDRKFADIGSIMYRQITNKIDQWADIISIHPILGKENLLYLDKLNHGIKIVLIADLYDNLGFINEEYRKVSVELANCFNRVIGIMSRDKLENLRENVFRIIPCFEKDIDIFNMNKSKNKIFLIGKDICDSENPDLEAERYKNILI